MANVIPFFPTGIDDLPKPSATTLRDAAGYEHDYLHSGVSTAINIIETKIGISGSRDENSLDYITQHAQGPQTKYPYSGTFSIDLSGAPYQSIWLTGDLVIGTISASRPQTSGVVKSISLRVLNENASHNIDFAAGVKSLGYTPPISIGALHCAIISISSWGPDETDTVAAVSVEP